jgi:branched-chain amino acid transport system substrate-binding protein
MELVYEDEEANPAVATQKAEKLFQVGKVDFLTGTVNSGSTLAVGQVAERNNRLIATTVSFADSITADKCSPNVFRVNARAGMQSAALADWMASTQKNANVFYLGPDYEMGRSTVAAFKAAAEGKGAKTVGEVFAPLDNKDYSPYFGQIRGARPTVIYTSVAGNDTVRLFTQMAEFGVNRNVQVVGASGTVTSQNLEGHRQGRRRLRHRCGLLDQHRQRRRTASSSPTSRQRTRPSPTCTAPTPMACLFFYKAAVEKAKSTDTDKVREAMRGLQWATPQGTKTMRAGDHQAMQDMYAVKVEGGKFQIVGKVAAARRPSGPTPAPGSEERRYAGLAAVRAGATGRQRPVDRRGRGADGAGLTIIFGLLDVINMAHGEFYAIGAYAPWR